MKMAEFDAALKESVRRLARQLAGLRDDQVAWSRRLYRNRVTRALGQIKEAMDERFPAPARKPVIRDTRNLTPNSRVAKMKRDGWVTASRDLRDMAAVAGVRVKRVTFPPADNGTNESEELFFIPGWAAQAPNATAMRQLKAARGKGRKGMLVDISLKRTA